MFMKSDLTFYLRGIAIFAVVANHYLNAFVEGNQSSYANGIIAIFFLVSGFGIYKSLAARIGQNKKKGRVLYNYFVDRFLKLGILFLFYVLIKYLYMGVIQYMDWFVSAIFMCYLLSPVIFYLLNKMNLKQFVVVLFFLLVILVNIKASFLTDRPFGFRGTFMSFLLLFSVGMFISKLEYKINISKVVNLLTYFCLALFLISVSLTRKYLDAGGNEWYSALFIINSSLFFFFFILSPTVVPLRTFFDLLGKHSYSIYLFHLLFYDNLNRFISFSDKPFLGLFLTLILFPFFLFFCIISEKACSIIRSFLSQYLKI